MKTTKKLLAILLLSAILFTAFAPMTHAATTECATQYPILLVHGAGFRDTNLFINYWGRIPKALEDRGAKIYYGGTDGWCSVEQGGAILKATVEKILKDTGSAKVNIIAHSKGGIEARYMISSLGMADKVASLTTVAAPHHGSKSMDQILGIVPDFLLRIVGFVADVIRWFWGDKKPDFYSGTQSLGTDYMKAFNKANPDKAGVYYQSFAGAMSGGMSDVILALTHGVIREFDGENDGMVSVESAKWTNFRGVLRGADTRGVSHMDEVDFRRTDFALQPILGATNMRDFYVAVAADLKQKGY